MFCIFKRVPLIVSRCLTNGGGYPMITPAMKNLLCDKCVLRRPVRRPSRDGSEGGSVACAV
jgi:hypothetical protein